MTVRHTLERLGITHDPLDHMQAYQSGTIGDVAVMRGMTTRTPVTVLVPISTGLYATTNRKALKGNTGEIYITHNSSSVSDKRLLLIGDSFNMQSMPVLSTYFRDIFYIRSAVFQPDLVDSLAPDCIVTGNAERYLCRVSADEAGSSVFLTGYGDPNYKPKVDFVEALQSQLSYKWYRPHYDLWVKRTAPFLHPDLGAGLLNQVSRDLSAPDAFVATGGDPWLLFNSTRLEDGVAYRLDIDLQSSVASTAQLFHCPELGHGEFSEGASTKCKVVAGRNLLSFPVPSRTEARRSDLTL